MFSFRSKGAVALGSAVIVAIGMAASNANAQLIISSGPIISSNGSGSYLWAYSLSVGANSTINAGDYLVLADFGAYTGTPVFAAAGGSGLTNTDFTFSEAYANLAGGQLQDTSPHSPHYDSPTVADVVLTYNGSTPITTGPNGGLGLGTVTLTTDSAVTNPGLYASYADAGNDLALGNTSVPSSPIPAGPLPLPATFWPGLGTLAAMALVGGAKLRKKFA